MKRKIGLLHTSPAVLDPLAKFYGRQAADLEVTNLLDDGLLRCLGQGDVETVRKRLTEMLRAAELDYGVELAMVTCSSVPRSLVRELRGQAGIPVLKIDEPMAQQAVDLGSRIGVVATFGPTLEPTSQLLKEMAAEAGREVELVPLLIDGAYEALLAGDADRHDLLLIEGVKSLENEGGVDVLVLAQLSMARVLDRLRSAVKIPVLSSIDTSLGVLREQLQA